MMDLSVVIVNYNVRQFLENALSSVKRAMNGLQGEIFVVDNGSNDGSVEMVRMKFPEVCLVESKINLGFAKANNLALKRASGRFLMLLNPDTVVQEDTFKVMLEFFDDNPDVGLAGCKVLNPDGSFQRACRRSFPTPWVAFTKIMGLSTLFPKSKLFGKYNLTYLSTDETYEVEAISGSFMMMRREAYLRVGGLDESFFMYGEDIDWCYRVAQAGFKVYYVHSTKIIHYKGESTKRSDIDEIKLFYNAMQLFVEKHFSTSWVVEFFLTTGILLRAGIAFLGKARRTLLLACIDIILVDCALLIGEYVYFGKMFHLPRYAYPVVWLVPGLIVAMTMYFSGAYTTHRYSLSRAAVSTGISYVLISALVYFAKDFAFSRAMVLIAGFVSVLLLPGFRLGLITFGRGGTQGRARKSLFGRRTVIVGTGYSAQEVLRKLRVRVDDGYDILGFIDMNRKKVGEKIAGVEIIGSIDNVGKVISERKVGEVIFSTEGISYIDILSVIARSNNRGVNFRLVPNSLESIIGKTRVDQLDDIPLVDIEYNIQKPVNRFAKRSFDLCCSFILLIIAYPIVGLRRLISYGGRGGLLRQRILLLPQVFSGRLSIVGRPLSDAEDVHSTDGRPSDPARNLASYLGARGLTGLVQINNREDLRHEEEEGYNVYYAKNQSLMLDIEIIMKSVQLFFKRRRRA